MNKKSGYALRIVLGGYLTYLGIRILSEMIQQRASNMTLMSVLAVVFILVGVAYAGNAICKTFEIDIKKQIAKMIAKRKAEQKRKAEEAAAAKEMSQVTESTTTEVSEDEKVSDNTMPTMLSEEDRKKLEDAVSKADSEEKTMQDSKAEAIEKNSRFRFNRKRSSGKNSIRRKSRIGRKTGDYNRIRGNTGRRNKS